MGIAVETLQRLQKEGALNTNDVARVTGATPRTVERWRKGSTEPPSNTKELLLYVDAAVKRARKYMSKDRAWAWLHAPNPYLDNDIPLDILAKDYKRVLDAIDAEAEGVYP